MHPRPLQPYAEHFIDALRYLPYSRLDEYLLRTELARSAGDDIDHDLTDDSVFADQ